MPCGLILSSSVETAFRDDDLLFVGPVRLYEVEAIMKGTTGIRDGFAAETTHSNTVFNGEEAVGLEPAVHHDEEEKEN